MPEVTPQLVLIGLTTSLVIPAHSFECISVYWLLFFPGAFAVAAFVAAAIRVGVSSAYVAASLLSIFASLVAIYDVKPNDFACHIVTLTILVVVTLGLFDAAFAQILLECVVEDDEGNQNV